MLRVLLEDPVSPHEAHQQLARAFPTTFILESRDGPARLARYSFVGWAPAATIRSGPSGLLVEGDAPRPHDDEAALAYLRRLLASHHTDDRGEPFVGGLVGQVGYGFVRELEPSLPGGSPDRGGRLVLGLYLDCLVYDHEAGTCTYVSTGPDRRSDLEVLRAHRGSRSTELAVSAMAADTDRASFTAQVRAAQALIAAGECFQIVLSRAYRGSYKGDLGACYGWLRDNSRVPYLYHLRFAGDNGRPPRALLGASPEMLVRVRDRTAETVPIAGTRPLTGNTETDAEAARSLLVDPKERAEHAMLVDLARNDLGRVGKAGTVRVDEYAQVAPFGPVQHLVSRVSATLADGSDALDALASIFPAGTVSGAPKLRAIEHIERLEEASRGAYAGCVLYASFNGDLDSAITIRSLEAVGGDEEGDLVVRAGAGIVAGSRPDDEFDETRRKASTILTALEKFGARIPHEEVRIPHAKSGSRQAAHGKGAADAGVTPSGTTSSETPPKNGRELRSRTVPL